ncbi:bifunctional diguanylate cyclase/phosphodiesterase [Neobacillus sp. D3-1R]|uniref:bifunctional diguanylate cyclase/phosphodiesterase n=1 Tax=Neobacillus sp. D3-1R TaxID=3445778 RepID=UPI003FA1860C
MAKSVSCLYQNDEQLIEYIEKNELRHSSNVLVQVFSGSPEKQRISEVQNNLKRYLPNATVIGCTTAGEIFEGEVHDFQIVLSFTTFEQVELQSVLLHLDLFEDNSYLMGKSITTRITSPETKAIILFPTSFDVNVQELLQGLHEECPNVVLAGGIAGDNGEFEEAFVFTGDEMTSKGIVAVSLQGKDLVIENFTNFEWQEIGQSFQVTKSKGTTILEIDNKRPIHILRKFLGDTFIDGLPQSGVEFPFILEDNGSRVSVFITKLHKNGAIDVNRKVVEGKKLTFAYANMGEIINNSLTQLKRLAKKTPETIFVYNCMARKRFMSHFTGEEMKMLNTISPISGFFSYGEIFYKKGLTPQIIGHSLSYLAISETGVSKEMNINHFEYTYPVQLQTMITLTHLMQESQNEIRNLNDNILTSEQYYRSLFDNNTDFVYSTDLNGRFTSVNLAFENTFGYSRDEILGKPALRYINEDDILRVKSHFTRTLKGKEQHYNLEIPSKDGNIQLFQMKNIPITINDEVVGIYGIGRNITEQKKIEERIFQLAYFDQDTGLPNRLKLTEILEEMLYRAKKKKRMLAVLSLDLDRFKIINDSLGHYAGDSILRDIVDRLKSSLPSGSYLGRFGGDKFTLILTKEIQMESVMKMVETVQAEISKPIFYLNQEFFISASIGVSLFPNDGLDEHALLKNADIAMNRSKNQGGNRFTFFSTEMNEQAMNRLELESYLRKALVKNEFFLCYQPLVDLDSGRLYGSEALIRWNHPKLGLVSPADFIPLAEETGLIQEIGSWVLYTACKQNKKWQEKGLKDLSVSVNVSAEQFQKPDFLYDVKNALAESGLEPKCLTLELTESIMLRNIENSINTMKALQEIGVKVSIDDFGTGYSSLSYLRNLPINKLKIDRSFIHNLRNESSDIAIVKAIITMGYGLDIEVVAEGVETKEQIQLLKDMKCHYAQGFYIHKPLRVEQFEQGFYNQK